MAAVLLFDAGLRRKQRNFRDRVTSLEAMSDAEAISKYRLNKQAISDLEERLRDDLSPKTDRSQALSSMTKTLIGLRYLAKGDFLSEVSEIHGVSKATAGRVLWPFIDSVNRRVNNIRFPTSRDEINAIKLKFFNTCRIPNVVGAVDGTLIPIIAPAEQEEAYVCRKGFHALNVQAVCDADMRIRDVVAMWPGSQHDAGIFSNCGLKAHLEQNDIGILLGDSGYALKKYLLTPKLRPATEQEERFNTFHSRGRMVIERCFGLLKSRFRCLHKTGGVLPFTPSRSTQVVTACARLHNLCLDYSVPEPHDQVIDAQHPATIMPDDPGCNVMFRQHIINMF